MGKNKRSSGEGSVRKLKSGTWHGEIMDGYDDTGKKRIISFSAPTRGEVLDKIRDYKKNKDANVHVNKKLLFGQWADLWYKDYESQVQASTYSGYRYTLNLIKKYFGENALCEILPMHINQFQDKLVKDGYSLSQISKCRSMLIQIFDAADNNGLILRNPARKSKILRDKDGTLLAPRREKDAFSEEEISLLEHGLDNDLMGNSILLMINSGLRTQELIALATEDIAEDGASINVDKAIKMVDGKPMLGPPKSKTSKRVIPVPEQARHYAIYLREHGGKERIWSLPGQNPLYSVGCFRRRYYSAIGRVEGVRKLSPHCCRHTYVTRLQARGVPIDIIAKLAGHSGIDTTVGYTHTSDATLQAAVTVLNEKE